MPEQHAQLSIGALSRATGVPPETLRTWERRYGVPASERTESGHRRYSLQTVERIRLITRVLELGHRPSTAVGADTETLRAILSQAGAEPERTEPPQPTPQAAPLASWFGHVERYEGRALLRELQSCYGALGARAFIRRRAAPFLTELGERWARGELGVRHEHFASERLREFLASQWRPLSDAAVGPTYVLATPAGEQHVLGLHLAALTVAVGGARVVFLGADVPAEDIARAAHDHSAEGALLSAAQGTDPQRLREEVATLGGLLPEATALGLGGRGFQGLGLQQPTFANLDELDRWLQRATP
ncbi:MAG: MerR family transcriptional regulator [Myxococcales bacterium]|nr:MerR family transcriptional regulator [Myxococcales bacterium]